jgi:hypothetical protein
MRSSTYKLPMNASFGQEITREMGKGLEDCFKEAKNVDFAIAKSLNHGYGVLGYIGKLPLIGKVVTRVRAIKPLRSLESELRTSLNNSLGAISKVGKKAYEERERIKQLDSIYNTAEKDNWTPKDFIKFIEENTDINYTVSLEGEQIDMKDLFTNLDSISSKERKEERQKEYLAWFKQHINLSEQYLESMNALCAVGLEWVGGMSRSYFDLTQLRGGMEEIQKTLENLGRGGTASMVSQEALRQYGTAYINGMRSLLKGYKEISRLKDSGSTEFKEALKQLTSDLNSTNQENLITQQRGNREIVYSGDSKQN